MLLAMPLAVVAVLSVISSRAAVLNCRRIKPQVEDDRHDRATASQRIASQRVLARLAVPPPPQQQVILSLTLTTQMTMMTAIS